MGHRVLYIPRSVIIHVEYGLLYNWYAATDAREISSSDDWWVPTNTEMNAMKTAIGGQYVAGGLLKETGLTYWNDPNEGATNSYGFNGRGAGSRSYNTGVFNGLKDAAYIWTSDEQSVGNTNTLHLNDYSDDSPLWAIQPKKTGASIRLVSDATGVADGTTTVYIGNDGKTYSAIAINGLYWTQYNLAETEYRNGDPIPTVEDNTTWAALTTAGCCAYNNILSNVAPGFSFPT